MSTVALNSVYDIFNNYEVNYAALMERKEISFANDYKSQSAKVALLACASFFEGQIREEILEILSTNSCDLTRNFIIKKSLARQYHTFFDWKCSNANCFFGLFGDEYKEYVQSRIKSDTILCQSIKDFLELGALRNKLAHDNYATFSLELTVENIKDKFQSALEFVKIIKPLSDDFKKQRGHPKC
ncbi:HEPN domain-containing protein [Marinagarivorans algicola]|uniref:HEPN domain-containing protein n=1 Tax=Marinagarivorans algicola TaxID=1513270 RepID=UPI0006B8CD57|nr:HEPN domain-containing protein [Marinagarivorans algicola]